jgi:hypothetical protein
VVRAPKLTDLEVELKRLTGVRSARVVGDDAPQEIHIIATPGRSAKQLVRDVQSLAAAGFDLPIDHRIVSVVQLGAGDAPAPDAPADGLRPVLERVSFSSRGSSGWVEVGIRWPSGEETEGSGEAGASRDARARAAVTALLEALEPALASKDARIDIDHVFIHRIGSTDSVIVRATFYEQKAPIPVVGCAIVYDDVASAAVRALLHAINRKLR